MKISIIIPVYNGEKYIKQCLDTVLNQTYKDIEVIIINDGSGDSSDKILKEYAKKDKRIVYINKENSGVSDTRNTGIKKSTGKYITFVDIDDTIELNTVEKAVKYIEKYKTDVVRMNYRIDNYIGEINPNLLGKNKDIKLLKYEILDATLPAFCYLLTIKKEILIKNKLKFNTKLGMMEDTIFLLELLDYIKTIYISNDVVYHYIQYETSSSHSIEKIEKNIKNVLDVNKIILSQNYSKELKSIASKRQMLIIIDFLKTVNSSKQQEILKDIKNNINFKNLLKNIDYKNLNRINRLFYISLKKGNYKKLNIAINKIKFDKNIKDNISILKYKINRIKNKYFKKKKN